MNILKGVSMVVGALILAWGVYAVSLSADDLGDFEYCTGKLNFEEGAEQGAYDEAFDVYVESPYLKRKVEMLQYYADENDDVYLVYSEEPIALAEGVLQGDLTRTKKSYYNPEFPEFPKSEKFYGTLTLGKDDVRLGGHYIEKLSYEGYLYFENEGKVYPIGGIEELGEVNGLRPIDDFTLESGDPEHSEVGDIRVSWEAIDPADFQPKYTAIGFIKDGVLEPGEFAEMFYDYKISKKEIISSFEGTNRGVGIGMIVVGLLGIGVPIFMIIKEKKEEKQA